MHSLFDRGPNCIRNTKSFIFFIVKYGTFHSLWNLGVIPFYFWGLYNQTESLLWKNDVEDSLKS